MTGLPTSSTSAWNMRPIIVRLDRKSGRTSLSLPARFSAGFRNCIAFAASVTQFRSADGLAANSSPDPERLILVVPVDDFTRAHAEPHQEPLYEAPVHAGELLRPTDDAAAAACEEREEARLSRCRRVSHPPRRVPARMPDGGAIAPVRRSKWEVYFTCDQSTNLGMFVSR